MTQGFKESYTSHGASPGESSGESRERPGNAAARLGTMTGSRRWHPEGDGVKRVFLAGVCLWVAGCGFDRNRATSDETAGVQSPDTEQALGEDPIAIDDPPTENPVREVIDDLEAQHPIASEFEPDALLEGLFSAWVDNRIIDLLFPDNRFLRGPEFLDGGPNTLYRLCVQDGTPEYICRQRYAP